MTSCLCWLLDTFTCGSIKPHMLIRSVIGYNGLHPGLSSQLCERLRQEDCKFKVTLRYRLSSWPATVMRSYNIKGTSNPPPHTVKYRKREIPYHTVGYPRQKSQHQIHISGGSSRILTSQETEVIPRAPAPPLSLTHSLCL